MLFFAFTCILKELYQISLKSLKFAYLTDISHQSRYSPSSLALFATDSVELKLA